VAWVVSQNLHRRHLSASQRAVIALDALPLFEAEAKARQLAGVRAQMHEGVRSDAQAGDAFKVSPRYVSDAKAIAAKAPALVERIRDGEMTITQAKRELKEQAREERRETNREAIAAADVRDAKVAARYATIVMDPPWDWGDEGDQDQLGRARPQYGTMPYGDLLALPVGDWADVDCHIYLWITNRSLPKGFALLEQWGFRYVSCLTWVKPSFGMGNYFRGQTEHVLFGVRGSQPLRRKDVGTWFTAERGKGHSAKPAAFMDLVESCSPGPYLEVFARSQRLGWSSVGAEA
jgi:N6-adenosine-specific RNA methylase IME4